MSRTMFQRKLSPVTSNTQVLSSHQTLAEVIVRSGFRSLVLEKMEKSCVPTKRWAAESMAFSSRWIVPK